MWVVALYITSSMHGPLDLKCNVMGNGAVGDDNQTSFKQWLGHTARITLTDGRLFEGQLVAVDSNHTLLMKYCTFHDRKHGPVPLFLTSRGLR